jgi:hypothetical protein
VPIVIDWRWYYHLPNLPLWLLLAAALVLPRANRQRQARAILIPVLVLTVFVGPMLFRLLSAPDSVAEYLGTVLLALVTGWGVVWLVAPWLARRHGFVAFLCALGMLALVGIVAYVGNFWFSYGQETLVAAMFYSGAAVSLVVGMTLSGLCCGGGYYPGRFLAWQILWMIVTCSLSLAAFSVIVAIVLQDPQPVVAFMPGLIVGAVCGAVIYVVNLPFMILARKNPFYRERFKQVFRMKDVYDPGEEADNPFLPELPDSTEPTEKAVTIQDVVGRWQFYLDDLGATVIVEFRPDGTFSQRIAANQGGVKDCCGGTWSLEASRVHLTDYVTAREETHQAPTWWMIDAPGGVTLFGGDGGDQESYLRLMRARGPVNPEGTE